MDDMRGGFRMKKRTIFSNYAILRLEGENMALSEEEERDDSNDG